MIRVARALVLALWLACAAHAEVNIPALGNAIPCSEGFGGNNCAVCKADAGCAAITGNPNATCSNAFAYAPNSQTKAYSCEFTVGTLQTLIQPGTLLAVCHTGLQAGETLAAAAPAPVPAAASPAPESSPAPEAAAPSPVPEPGPSLPPPADAPAAAPLGSNGSVQANSVDPSQATGDNGTSRMLIDLLARLFGGAAAANPGEQPAAQAGSSGGGGGRRRLQQSGPSPDNPPSGAWCSIQFTVKSPQAKVYCQTTDCTMAPNATLAQCKNTQCACLDDDTCGGGVLTRALVGGVNSANGYASVDCKDGGECAVKLTGIPGVNQLDVSCTAGECLVPLNSTLSSTGSLAEQVPTSGVENRTLNSIIAAIPTMVLVLAAAALGFYVLLYPTNMGGYSLTKADVASLEAAAAKPVLLAGAPRVGVLEFTDITVSVPISATVAEKRRAALRSKVLRHAETMHTMLSYEGAPLLRFVHSAKERLHLSGKRNSGASDPERPETPLRAAPSGLAKEGAGDDGDLKSSSPAAVSASEASASGSDGAGPTTASAADFVCSLHEAPDSPGAWFILGGVSGRARGGEVVGVLGPSGCGKTSLLGSIAGSAMDLGSAATLTGAVTVDGHRRRQRQVAYVPQSDLLIPSLTVQECLRYSALLRLPPETSPLDIQVAVDTVLAELGLRHVADSQVGGGGRIRGVSGGERRRVTIGMELVTDPDIIVLDEPTSGLDSYTADSLLTSLHQVAAGGRVVVASLHQPSRDIFFRLDQVMLMGHGRLLYMGPPGEAEAWAATRGLPCPAGRQLAEHLLKLASSPSAIRRILAGEAKGGDGANGGAAPEEQEVAPASPRHGHKLSSTVETTEEDEEPSSSERAPGTPAAPAPNGAKAAAGTPPSLDEQHAHQHKGQPRRRAAGLPRQLSVLVWRSWVDIVRSPTLLRLHCVVAALMGLLTGAVFWDMDYTNIGIQNRMGGTFFALAFLAFTSLTTVDLLLAERQVVAKEVRGGYYQPAAYLASKLSLDAVLLRALPAVLYWAPFYYMAGFRAGSAYAATYAFGLITFSCAMGGLSMAVTAASDTAGAASFAMNCILLISLVFTGFLVNISAMPAFLRWVHYLSLFFYAWEGLVTSEVDGLSVKLDAGPYQVNNLSGELFLETLGLSPTATTRDLAVLVGMWAGFVLLAMAIFLLRLPRQPSAGRGGWLRAVLECLPACLHA